MSKNADWILQCIGIYQGGDYLDEIEDNFKIDLDLAPYEVIELIEENPTNLGNQLAVEMFEMVIQSAVNELKAKSEDFDYYCNGSLDTHLYYKQEEVSCWEDIVKLNQIKNLCKNAE